MRLNATLRGVYWPKNKYKMIGKRFPRTWLFTLALGVAAAAIMLSMFYGQYRWLAHQIVTTSSEQHYALMKGSFERRARSKIHGVADAIIAGSIVDDDAALQNALSRTLDEDDVLTGIRFTNSSGEFREEGSLPPGDELRATSWLNNRLLISYPVIIDDDDIGYLTGSFRLDELEADYALFGAQLSTSETRSSRASYLWIFGVTFAMLVLGGCIIWLVVQTQSRRIGQLKIQAEKLRDADFW